MAIELTRTALVKARAISTTLGAMTEAAARDWLIRALPLAKKRDDLALGEHDSCVYEMPPDHLTAMGGRLAAVVVDDTRPVAVTIKALSSFLHRDVAYQARRDQRIAAEAVAEAKLDLDADRALTAPARGVEKLAAVAIAPVATRPALVAVPSPTLAKPKRRNHNAPTAPDNRGARALRVLMAERQMTQEGAAKQAGLTSSGTIGKIACGSMLPLLRTALQLEDAYRISVRWWIEP